MTENFAGTIDVLRKEIADLQAKVDDLTEAVAVLWLDADHNKWDAKAVERFNKIVEE